MEDNAWVVILLSVNTFLLGIVGWFLSRYVKQNDEHHKLFFETREKVIAIDSEHHINHPRH